MKSRLSICGAGAVLVALAPVIGWAQQVEPGNDAKWYVSGSLGAVEYEGDEPVKDGFQATIRLGYDYSEWWSFEGSLDIAPKLDENTRYDIYQEREISRLEEIPGNEGVHDAAALGFSLDALFHFTRWERLDPYLTLGMGVRHYTEDLGDGQNDAVMRAGGGVMYHFNDEWALRADGRTYFAGSDTEANASFDAGFVWTWGARVPPRLVAVGGPVDSDGDGLTDVEEGQYGTDPYDPDTDKDELTDGQEVKDYKTNPLKPDTDIDGLTDGAEVLRHQTNPLKSDTDNGGVSDGHEVLEDLTDPLNPADDLVKYELYIQFDLDKSVVKDPYFHDLDTIGKVLRRNPGSTARVEGHADRTKKSREKHNLELSQRRAEAVVEYLVTQCKVEANRLSAHGYGFSRPKAENDPVTGNPLNRRVEVYIRGVTAEKAARDAAAPATDME